MKNAVLENGTQIAAQEEAPTEALCPLCGHPVSLRKRRLMNNPVICKKSIQAFNDSNRLLLAMNLHTS